MVGVVIFSILCPLLLFLYTLLLMSPFSPLPPPLQLLQFCSSIELLNTYIESSDVDNYLTQNSSVGRLFTRGQ